MLNSLRSGDIFALVIWVIIVADDGLLPVLRQAITWTIADLLSTGP